jgi:hypothetical protein
MYPFAVEPTMGLRGQSALWALGFAALLLLLVGCASTIWRQASVMTTPLVSSGERLIVRRRLRWVLLASVPSSLTNRYFDLERVAAGLCTEAGLVCRLRADSMSWEAYAETGRVRSTWAAMGRDAASLGELLERGDWRPFSRGANGTVWTDDYSSLTSVLRPLAS